MLPAVGGSAAASSQYDLPMRSEALAHVRVLDLSRVLAGPWASQVLADLGAEVIKVERPGVGDETRGWGPPWLERPGGAGARTAAYFAATNRGKRSVTIDISRPEGQAIVRRLAARADVLLENYKVGALARHGLVVRRARARRTRGSCTARSAASARTGRTATGPATTSSSRRWAGS